MKSMITPLPTGAFRFALPAATGSTQHLAIRTDAARTVATVPRFLRRVVPIPLLLITLLFLCALSGFSQAFRFGAHHSPSPDWITAHGDVNGDGFEDLILLAESYNDPTVFSVLLSNGDGTFRAPVTYSHPPNGGQVVLMADLNGDGKLDVMIRTADPHGFLIYFGKGDGTFLAPASYSLTFPGNWSLGSIQAADVNHDNQTDLIVGTINSGTTTTFDLHVLLSNGDGTFRNGPTTTDVGSSPYSVGDFDGDGKIDVLMEGENIATAEVYFRILYGDGTGKFPQSYDLVNAPFDVEIAADVNGDGIMDLITSPPRDPATGGGGKDRFLIAFYGRSDRTMQQVEIPTNLGCPEGAPSVADYNGDHIPDIAFEEDDCTANNVTPASLAILPGRGNNDFGPEQTVFAPPNLQAENPQALRGNRDTKADIILDEWNPSFGVVDFVTLLNSATGSFPSCAAPNATAGIALCSPLPGSTVSSPIDFAVAAAGETPMRKAEIWADGHKIAEQFAGAFTEYSFLDASVALAPGPHHIAVLGAGWDNSLESSAYNINVTPPSCAAPNSPGVHVCSPAEGTAVHSPVHLEAMSTVTGTLARMEVWIDGVKRYTSANHLDTNLALSAGSHRFVFLAVNTNGQTWQSTVYAVVQ